jgi:hypothetical protein
MATTTTPELGKMVRGAYDSWIAAQVALSNLHGEVAQPTKSLESFKAKLDAIKKQIKECQTKLADLKKKADAVFDVSNEDLGDQGEYIQIIAAMLSDSYLRMKKIVDQAAKIVK